MGPEGVIHQDIDDDLVLPKSHVEEFGVLQRYPEIVSCVCRVVTPFVDEEVTKGRRGRRRKREKSRGRHDPASAYETLFYMFGGDEEAEEVVDRYGDGDLITEIRPRAASLQRSSSLQRRRQRIWEEQREQQQQQREREKKWYRYRDGPEYVLQQQRQQPYSRSAWEVLTTAASKAEYTPRPAVYAPKTVEEVVTRITEATPTGVVDERLGDAVFDYVRIGDRAASTSPILTRRRVHSSER